MLFSVSDYSIPKPKQPRRQPRPPEGNARWQALDDTRAAGPYCEALDDCGLFRLCLETIRQAVMDERSHPNAAVVMAARNWLQDTPRLWLKVFGVWRRGGDPRMYDLIYGSGAARQLDLGEREDGEDPEEKDIW